MMAEHRHSSQSTEFRSNLAGRHRVANTWQLVFQVSTAVGIIALTALLFNVINQSFGLVAIQNRTDPAELAVEGVPLEQLSRDQLVGILERNVSAGLFRRLDHDQPFDQRTRDDMYSTLIKF